MSLRPASFVWRLGAALLLAAACATRPRGSAGSQSEPAPPAPRPASAETAPPGLADSDDSTPCPKGHRCPSHDPEGDRDGDGDGDGILDSSDLCPEEPGVLPDGCAIPDRDGDGILDPDDPCPDEPETDNAFQTDGCPEELPEYVAEALSPYHYSRAEFEAVVRSNTLKKKLRATLSRLAAVLREYPELRVEIDFHRDSREPHVAYWRNVSGYLSGAAKRFLVEHEGIDESRIEERDAGPDEPIDTNRTEKGRAKNRRLEFTLIE